MRTLLWWLLLLCLCAFAGLVQIRWRKDVQAERQELRAIPDTLAERERGWARITIGEPSGAEPVLIELWLPEPESGGVVSPADPGGGTPFVDLDSPPPGYRPPDYEYTVPRGRVLSKICEEFYGTGRPPISQRVAEYNGMESPDELRENQVLKLPPRSVLFPEER